MGTVTSRLGSVAWFVAGAVIAGAVTLISLTAWRADAAPGDSDSTLVAISPCRLADTRDATRVGTAGPLGNAATQTFETTGKNGECDLPSSAVALQLNVTALGASEISFLTFWPADEQRPLAANLNPWPGQPPIPNAVTVQLASDGEFKVYNDAGTVNVVIDVNGYFTKDSLKELNSGLAAKADADDVYTKAQVDAAIAAVTPIVRSAWALDIVPDPDPGTDSILLSVTVDAPQAGVIQAHGSMLIWPTSDAGEYRCWLSTGSDTLPQIPGTNRWIDKGDPESNVCATNGAIAVEAGTHQVNLVSSSPFGVGFVDFDDSTLDVVFYPGGTVTERPLPAGASSGR